MKPLKKDILEETISVLKELIADETIELTKHECRAILHWLSLVNGKWVSGSYTNIKQIHNLLKEFSGWQGKKWRWKNEK